MDKNFRKFLVVISGLIIILNIAFNKNLYFSIPVSLLFGFVLGRNLAKIKYDNYNDYNDYDEGND